MPASRASKRRSRQRDLDSGWDSLDSDDNMCASIRTLGLVSTPLQIPIEPTARLFVASIGNPSPYLSTLHSAGHTVLHKLARRLEHDPFSKSRMHANGFMSRSGDASPYTLWQSPSLMNVSGVPLAVAWRQFVKDHGRNDRPARLVVLHDELELALGAVRAKSSSCSPMGHNGLKSIRQCILGEYTRIGIGIGRPESRDPGVVARYVLSKTTGAQRRKIEGAVDKVLEELERLATEEAAEEEAEEE